VVHPAADVGGVGAADVDVVDVLDRVVVGDARRSPASDEHAASTHAATAIAKKACGARSMIALLTSVYQASRWTGSILCRAEGVGAVARK